MIVFFTLLLIAWSLLWIEFRGKEIDRLIGDGFRSEEITTFLGAFFVLCMDFIFFPILYATEHTNLYKYAKMLVLLPVAPIILILWGLNYIELKLKGVRA